MSRVSFLLLICCLVAVSCGYQFSGQGHDLPDGISRLKVDLFTNRTAEPHLETYLTASSTLRLMRQDNVELVETLEQAEAVLTGEVVQYSLDAVSYDALDEIKTYRITMKVVALLKRISDGKILWQQQFVRYDDFSSDPASIIAQEDQETVIQKAISIRLAEDISWQMANMFGGG